MADAAVASGVPFYIYSTLPHTGVNSDQRLKRMCHFDGKAEVEAYIRTLPMTSAFAALRSFMSIFHASMAPMSAGGGVYALAITALPEAQLPLLGTAGDTGK